MANEVTLAELRARLRKLTDTENDPHKTDAWLNELLNEARKEVFETLRRADPDFYESTQTIITSGFSDTFSLPDDHHLTKGVEWLSVTSFRVPLQRVSFRDRLDYQLRTGYACKYRLVGGDLVLYPLPPVGQTYYHTYVPAPVELVNDTDTVDGRESQLIVYTAAIPVALKDETPTAEYEKLRDRELQRLSLQSEDRASLEAPTVSTVESFEDRPFRYGRFADEWWR